MAIRNAGNTVAALLLLAAVTGCAPAGNEQSGARAERQKIIVEFAMPAAPAGAPGTPADPATAARTAAEAILSRLDATVRESAKLYEHLPLMALEADAATVMRLLRMPEVMSMEADRPVSMFDQPGGAKTYGAPSDAASK